MSTPQKNKAIFTISIDGLLSRTVISAQILSLTVAARAENCCKI